MKVLEDVRMTTSWQADSQHIKQIWQEFNYKTHHLSSTLQTDVSFSSERQQQKPYFSLLAFPFLCFPSAKEVF